MENLTNNEWSNFEGYTDFDGVEFFKNVTNCKMIDDEMIKKYAPNVVEGINKLSNWAKNL